MKKILFIVPSLGMGGMERVLVNYANLFTKRGYCVTVYNLTSHDDSIVKYFDKKVNYYPLYMPVKSLLRCGIKEILKLKFRILTWKKWIAFHSSEYLHKKYIRESFDIEVSFFGMESMKIVSGADNSKVQTLAWIHGEQKNNDFSPIKTFSEAVSIINKIDKLICVSEGAKKTVSSVYGRTHNLFVVNNPNDSKMIKTLAEEAGCPEKKEFTFVNASRFDDKQKGYSRILDVCQRLNDDGFKYRFWLVGDGVDFQMISQKIHSKKISNILLLGKQENPYKFIKNADMYVCFSYSEGFSMVMMETIILATPLLSTNVPGANEMLDGGKYGMIVENSEEGLYQGMKSILENPDLYKHYCEMAEKRKDYLSEDRIMNQIEGILGE